MGSGDQLWADKGVLAVECLRIDFLQRVTSKVIVAVSRSSGEMDIADSRLLHGFNDL